ncbi:MAG: hypothetical protein ACK8QZ_03075, partial [Anaerolineales bacterium]
MGKKTWAGKIKSFYEWVWNAIPLLLALLTFLWILFAMVIWPSQNTRNFRIPFELSDGRRLEVWGPAVVPLETPVDLYFVLHQEKAPAAPLTLQVIIPEDLVTLSPSPNPLAGRVTLTFDGTSPEETRIIQLANAKQRSGMGITRQAISIEQAQGDEARTIEINVEQTWRGVLRQSGGGGSDVPLGPIITLVPFLGTLLSQYISRSREEQEKRARQAGESLSKIRQALQQKNLEAAEKNLIFIEQQGLEAHLEAGDLTLARQLLQLAKGDISSLSFESFPEEWLEAAAGAVLYAARHNLSDRPSLEQLMRSFPADRLQDDNLKSEWQDVHSNIGAMVPSQAREWPRPSPKQWPTFAPPIASGLSENPFPHHQAEEEEAFLFASDKSLFWSDHPVFNALKERRSIWITGEAGSGKTALALGLGKYVLGDRVFSERGFGCYFKGLPSVSEIRRALASRLLDSILQNPSYLPFGKDQHRLLAEMLLADLSPALILGCIEQTTAKATWDWLEEAQNNTQRELWQAEARSRLRLLAEAVRKGDSPLPEPLWPSAWSSAIRFLGFESGTRLVFDRNASPSVPQESRTLDTLAKWAEYGIHTLVFSLPDKRLKPALAGWTSPMALTWNETDIQQMAQWRWRQVYPTRNFETL